MSFNVLLLLSRSQHIDLGKQSTQVGDTFASACCDISRMIELLKLYFRTTVGSWTNESKNSSIPANIESRKNFIGSISQ
jgi:hypothetical protein